ncbi:MAG: ATP phosphoribosyltransferase [Pseudomonadales bacterium]|nr:ATP phosphoribosyltransferase [Pseudomonadales bacterium]
MSLAPVVRPLTLALTRGRILKECLPLLARVGISPQEDPGSSRKLVITTSDPGIRLLVLRGSDVPVYVRHGAADAGVVGRDVLLETGSEGLYEPLDLGIARCRLMTAGLVGRAPLPGRVRVATKFVNVARRFYAAQGRQVDIIKLSGAMELAPVLGLAERIVDIVDTGNTLRANGLEPIETIAQVSSRLVVNKASMKLHPGPLRELVAQLSAAVRAMAAEVSADSALR